jgi:beta-glucosidase
MLQSAIASMMQGVGGAAAIMPEGVDITRMLDSFPIGRIGMFAAGSGGGVDPAMIDALIAAANGFTEN